MNPKGIKTKKFERCTRIARVDLPAQGNHRDGCYDNNRKADCELAFAWANIAVPA